MSHRFSTVRMADLIVVLDGARVVEVGTHEDLMAAGGQYAELYTIQAKAYRADPERRALDSSRPTTSASLRSGVATSVRVPAVLLVTGLLAAGCSDDNDDPTGADGPPPTRRPCTR